MDLVDIWEMPPGWGVPGTVPLQHTQGQCVVWHSDTDNASSTLHSSTWDFTQKAKSQKKPKENKCVCEMSSNIHGCILELCPIWGFCIMIESACTLSQS